jgi:hypothetical protein
MPPNYQEDRNFSTPILRLEQHGKLVAPLVFQGGGNTEMVDACFEKVLLPVLPPDSVIVPDNEGFHQSPITEKLVVAAGCKLPFYGATHPTSIPSNAKPVAFIANVWPMLVICFGSLVPSLRLVHFLSQTEGPVSRTRLHS